MALPKKRSRTINIDGVNYRYIVSGNSDAIDLTIEMEHVNGQRFITCFDYHNHRAQAKTENGETHSFLTQTNQITPGLVKEVIEFGIQNGWNPEKSGKVIRINSIDDKVNLKLLPKPNKN